MAFDLYSLLPAIIRLKDSATAGSSSEGILERLLKCFDQEADTTATQIAGLLDLINPDECDEKYLLYISLSLGFAVSNSTSALPSIEFARWFVKNLIAFYKIKGTHPSWHKQWSYVKGEDLLRAWELWKQNIYERGIYYRYGGGNYYGLYHAARVDLYRDLLVYPEFVAILSSIGLMDPVEWCRPIHVLLRKSYYKVEITDIATKHAVDVQATAAALHLAETLSTSSDEIAVTISCVATCEVACEPSSEVGCVVGCELTCEPGVEMVKISTQTVELDWTTNGLNIGAGLHPDDFDPTKLNPGAFVYCERIVVVGTKTRLVMNQRCLPLA